MKKYLLLGVSLLVSGILLTACGTSGAGTAEADAERYVYYQKEGAIYRADIQDPASPVVEEMIGNLDEEATQIYGVSNYTTYLSKDGSYTAIQANVKTEKGTFSSVYAMKNQPGAEPELVADRIGWVQMDGNTLVFNKASRDVDSSDDSIWCYRPSEGSWQVAAQGADYGPELLRDDHLIFSTYDYGDYYGNNMSVRLYYADVSEKKKSEPQILADLEGGYVDFFDASDDFSKIYYIKQEGIWKEGEKTPYGFYVLEDRKEEKRLCDDPSEGAILSLDPETESFYVLSKQEAGGEDALADLYYYNEGDPELLSSTAEPGYSYNALAPGLLRYTEKPGGAYDGESVAYLARGNKTAEITGVSYSAFAESDDWYVPINELYDPENETYFAVCMEENDLAEREYRLVQVSLDEESFGEMKLIDTQKTSMHITCILGDQVYYYMNSPEMAGLADSEDHLELYCNGERIAEEYKEFSLIEINVSEQEGEKEHYFMTRYPERSHQYLTYVWNDAAVLWRMNESGAAEKMYEEVMQAEFRENCTVLMTDYQNPEMQGRLCVEKEGTLYEIDTKVEKCYLNDRKNGISSCDFYLQKDEPEEAEADWGMEEDSDFEMDWSVLEELYAVQQADMTDEEIEEAKANGEFYIEDYVYHSPNDLYTLTLGSERNWGLQTFSFQEYGSVIIQDQDSPGNMTIQLTRLEEHLDLTKDASEYPDIEDRLTMYTENELISCENITLDGTPALKVRFSDVEWGINGYYIAYLVNDAENNTHTISISYLEEDAELEEDMTEVIESFRWSNQL